MRRSYWLFSWALFLALVSLPKSASAQEPNQAALVVQFDGDRLETRCIAFNGDTVTGDKLLALSGLDVLIDASGGMGVTVCRVEGLGCDFPTEHCFCQCMGGGPCAYWNYFYRDPGSDAWIYSPLGAGLHKVKPGSVEAWVWGDGHTPPSADLTFETVCAVPTAPVPTSTPRLETQASASPTAIIPEATPVLVATQAPTPTPTASFIPTTPPPTLAPIPSPTPATAQNLSSYWPFGLIVLALAVISGVVRFRRT
jgi:hypothetical protein